MGNQIAVLMVEAMVMYFLVLGSHSLRHRFGPVHFYALMGGITAIMAWVTDAGMVVELGGITFVVGSTVFYTSLLLGVFVVYVFDGPRMTRITISTVIIVSIMMPLIAAALHFQTRLMGDATLPNVPLPSIRINSASVFATLLDLIFLGIAWEFLGKQNMRFGLWLRTWLTLLGVMWLDVLLFATLAFAGTPAYFSIMLGTLSSRFLVSLLALPFLYGYILWQNRMRGIPLEERPVLAILRQVAEIEAELSQAQQEIERRKRAETALLEAQDMLIRQERMAAVGQLTTGLAHTFNNLLTTVMLRLSLLSPHMNGGAEGSRMVAQIQAQLEEVARLVEKLLDFSSRALLRPKSTDLCALIRTQVADMQATAPANVAVQLDLPPGPCLAFVDPARLGDVVHNLVQNSLDAMPDGGTVTIRVSNGKVGAECVVCHGPIVGEWIELVVSDTGRGIDPGVQARVFDPFFTTDIHHHNGLGLSQSLGIVKQHQGHLALASRKGEGTTVTVALPKDPATA